ncbi:MAG: pyridoxamine 5'-phosphate oxidase [Chloroflexi bacterium RBG_13_51_18]|nr:MAG: pyridoxamine 5'-phosphate oxidase [Chloroflexi bacterium RBG_13_51_18]
MDFKDCIKFANDNKTCYLATAEGDQPRVRAMGMWYADETGFYFQAQSVKAVCKQLDKNPKVEIYFQAKDFSKVLRVSGKARAVTDMKIRARCIEERPFVKNFGITTPDNPLLAIYQVYTGEAYFWTMADSMKEAELPRIKFGKI